MKEYKDSQGNIIREFDFNDWKEGKIFDTKEPGKKPLENKDTRELWYEYLPVDQYNLIRKEQEKIYWKKVEDQFARVIEYFKNLINISFNKERLIGKEIEKIEFLLFAKQNISSTITFDQTQLSWLRALYPKLIERGEREFHFIDFQGTSPKDRYHILTETHAKYLEWLKGEKPKYEFDFNKDLKKEKEIERWENKLKFWQRRKSDYRIRGVNLISDTDYKIRIKEKIKMLQELIYDKEKEELRKIVDLPQKDRTPKVSKPFHEYLVHPKRKLLADEIKKEFNTEIGKGIRLIIESLLDHDPPLITIENRQRLDIYKALKKYLNRNIGSYQSIFNYQYSPQKHKLDFDSVSIRLKFILDKLQ